MNKISLIFLLLFCANFSLYAQKDSTENIDALFAMSIEELVNIDVNVITKKPVPIRENAAVMTVISEQDIQNSGLRDLKEVLAFFVPGIQFGADVEGAVSIAVRGMWAFEGKMLLMIDGLECNEEMFANLLFSNHYFVDNIKRIEISKGPGSSVYGGYAGLSVINIKTKNQTDSYFSSSYSQMSKNYAQRYVSAAYGKEIKDFSFSINAGNSTGVKSQRNNTDYLGNSIETKENTAVNSTFLNANVKYKGLNIRAIVDKYHYKQVDLWGVNYPEALSEYTDTYLAEIYYEKKLNKKHKITPRFVYKYQEPWHLDIPDEKYANSKYISKYQAQLTHSWDITKKFNLLSGVEYFNSALILPENHKSYEETFINNKNNLTVSNFALYSQAILRNRIANFTIGGRYDLSSEYGYSFVPRVAVTKIFGRMHFKTMLGQSFRIPGGIIPNRIPEGENGIEPEKATTLEAEIGYTYGYLYFTTNIFAIRFNKVIQYAANHETGLGSYINSGSIGSEGIEFDLIYRKKNFNLTANYSYHHADNSDVTFYLVPTHPDYFLAFSPHRINTMLNIRIYKNISFTLTGEFFGKKYGFTQKNQNEDVLTEFKPIILLNSNVKFNKVFGSNLYITVGVSNISDSEINYIQPYRGEHAPIPGLSRSVDLKLFYKI